MKIHNALTKPGNKGFTLMEVLIVIIIIAVLAGLAVPMYRVTVEKSRKAEALGVLSAIRQAEVRYRSQYPSYTNSTGGTTDATRSLDFDFSAAAMAVGGQRVHFTYAVTAAAADTFTATATRDTTVEGAGAGTVTINQLGDVGGTGNFA